MSFLLYGRRHDSVSHNVSVPQTAVHTHKHAVATKSTESMKLQKHSLKEIEYKRKINCKHA